MHLAVTRSNAPANSEQMAKSSTSLVIFGANGDLSRRKLIPALLQLHCNDRLPDGFNIIGVSRTPFSDDEYRESMWESAVELVGVEASRKQFEEFSRRLFYEAGDLSSSEGLAGVDSRLADLEQSAEVANRMFYFSIAPGLYESAVASLDDAGIAHGNDGWSRLVIEKPFGTDRASATKLDSSIHAVFPEKDVFRIDHYLGKETVQNRMVLRFANSIFEPIWNRNYVKSVQITVAEEVDAASRAAYYDSSGLVRDMLQNHLLQILTIIAMEPPSAVDPESLRDRRVDVLRAIAEYSVEDIVGNAVAGTYEGYRSHDGVDSSSKTPTYAALKLQIDNWRWQGVPFYLRTGKALENKNIEGVVEFQRPPHFVFGGATGAREPESNILAICLQPDEGAHLRFQVKVPGRGMEMKSADMQFHYDSAFRDQVIPEAYERLLQDALDGDASLFIRSDQIAESWRIVDPLNAYWESDESDGPAEYSVGSTGPIQAADLLTADGNVWLQGCGTHD